MKDKDNTHKRILQPIAYDSLITHTHTHTHTYTHRYYTYFSRHIYLKVTWFTLLPIIITFFFNIILTFSTLLTDRLPHLEQLLTCHLHTHTHTHTHHEEPAGVLGVIRARCGMYLFEFNKCLPFTSYDSVVVNKDHRNEIYPHYNLCKMMFSPCTSITDTNTPR